MIREAFIYGLELTMQPIWGARWKLGLVLSFLSQTQLHTCKRFAILRTIR
jgi:uncharacterized protein (DUF2062 family)